MSTVSLSTQAKLLARYIREKELGSLTHTQALEALAHAQNFSSHNTRIGERRPKASQTKWDRLKAQLQEGVRSGEILIGDVLNALAETQGTRAKLFVEAARSMEEEGELEFDDTPIVSLSDDGGAYVMSWSWVELPEGGKLPQNPAASLILGYDYVGLSEQGDEHEAFELRNLELNSSALEALCREETLSEKVVVLQARGENAFTWTVGHLKALKWNSRYEYYEGEYQGKSLILEFSRWPL